MLYLTCISLLCLGTAYTVDISVNIQLGDESDVSSCGKAEMITASNEEELRKKLEEKFGSLMLEYPDQEVTISTQIHDTQSNNVVGYDVTSTAADVTSIPASTKENLATTNNATDSTMDYTSSSQESKPAENCDVEYNSKCFRVHWSPVGKFNLTDAQKVCKTEGWELANIYDGTHYRLLQDDIRRKIPGDMFTLYVWTGMTIKNGNLHLTNGDNITLPADIWYPRFPYSEASRTNIALEVNKASAFVDQGITNRPPAYNTKGVICEI